MAQPKFCTVNDSQIFPRLHQGLPWIIESLMVITAVLFLSPISAQESKNEGLTEIGFARVDITPGEPIRLSGYRVRSEPTGEVDGKLWAKALAIGSDRQKPAVLITVELVGITRTITDTLAERLTKTAGVTRDQLAVCVTHTHSGPFVKGNLPNIFGKPIPTEHQKAIDRYKIELEEKLERVALEALRQRKPARLSWSQGKVDFAANRRTGYLKRSLKKGAKPPAPVDHDLPALFVHSPDGKFLAALLSYACHCTTLGGNEYNRIHGDWAGEAAMQIENRYPDALAMVAIGCGADQNPNPRGSLAYVKAHGQQIADEIDRLLKQTRRPLHSIPQCRYRIAELPFGKLPTEADLKQRLKSKTERVRYYAQILLDRKSQGIELPGTLKYPIQTWTFGNDLAMVFLPGEVVVDYGLRLKRELDSSRIWVNGYSNDVPCYIASKRVIGEGGYEVDTSMDSYDKPTRFDPSVENIIIKKTHELLPDTFRIRNN